MIDSQSVKNTDTARDKGYDAGKKVSGIKSEPYRVCRRLNILRDYADEKTKLYP